MYLFPNCDPIAFISSTAELDKATEKIYIPPSFNRRATFSTRSGHFSLLLQELSVNKTKAFAEVLFLKTVVKIESANF